MSGAGAGVPEAGALEASVAEASAAAPLLEVSDLSVSYRAHGRRDHGRREYSALDRVSLDIRAGETVGVVGESGAGKSTLGRAVLGLVPASSGTIRFGGQDITRLSRRERVAVAARLQVVFQDPDSSLNPARTVRSSLAEPLLGQRRPRAEVAGRVAEMLERVGLPADAAGRYPRQFSGGQKQRIAIARALIVSPELVVCDEALSALDLSVQAQIINLLLELRRDLGLAYLFIGHDLAVVRHLADRVLVLRQGQVVEQGTAAQVCEQPADPYTKALMAAAPVPDPREERARLTARAAGLGGRP
ncbi:MAG TPA: ATP-binding cassette domain-containing protein [Trebonia sp.]|jgi:peptide/nickel transport system ATP-binding protein|nr:ATP-binding cassette domain-containing protein [Trebonia sp.]